MDAQTVVGARAAEVSVVIPTRNRPHLVMRAVASALEQTVPPLEVIVVIDGEDTATLSALKAHGSPRLRWLPLTASVGGAEARNVGIRAAQGEWIALLDDDDEWAPEKLEKQLAAALASGNPKILVFSRMTVRMPHIEFVWPRRLPRPQEPISEYLFCRKGLSFGDGFLQTSSFFASKQLFLQIPFTRDQQRFQDTEWLLRAGAYPGTAVHVLPEPLVIYDMQGQQSVSRKSDWQYLFRWARANQQLFTPKAYAFFIAGQCVPRAAKEKAPFSTFLMLLKESVFHASPTWNVIAMSFVFWFLPERFRQGLRDRFAQFRRLWAPKTTPPKLTQRHSLGG